MEGLIFGILRYNYTDKFEPVADCRALPAIPAKLACSCDLKNNASNNCFASVGVSLQ